MIDIISYVSFRRANFSLKKRFYSTWFISIYFYTKNMYLISNATYSFRADSVTWNPHKLLTAPQQCSTLLLRHEGILSGAHSANAAYLFQKDKFYDTKYDTGDKHVQCGRRADVLKFWFMWKAKGTSGFEKHIDKVILAKMFCNELIFTCL